MNNNNDKMLELLAKIRKGATASCDTVAKLIRLVEFLGGWQVNNGIEWVQTYNYYSKNPADAEFVNANAFTGQNAADFAAGRVLYKITEEDEDGIVVAGFVATPYWEFVDPTGKSWKVFNGDQAGIRGLPINVDRSRTAAKTTIYQIYTIWSESTIKAQTLEILGLPEHIPATERTLDGTGTCSVCWRNIKLNPNNKTSEMANHGYQRPGTGENVGCCSGEEFPALELSDAGTRWSIKSLTNKVENLKVYITNLKNKNFETVTVNHRMSVWQVSVNDPEIDRIIAGLVHDAEWKMNMAERELARHSTVLANWKVRPLPKAGERITSPIEWK